MTFSESRWIACATFVALFFCAARPAVAHVGSPNVFYESDAGPYHLLVAVIVPQVIPGVAEVQVRAASNDVRQISTVVTRLAGAGSTYAPVPDLAVRSTTDPHLFTSTIWLMEYGSLRVLLKVSGDHGSVEISVPVASFARRSLPMPRWLGALLLTLAVGLALGMISIVGAAVREAGLAPGTPVENRSRRSGLVAMAATSVIIAAISYLAFVWWNVDATDHARLTRAFEPPRLTVALDGTNRLQLTAADSGWSRYLARHKLLPDHGHLMHMFLVRTPGFDRFWHLHPEPDADGSFDANLPHLDAGHYDVFADIVDESGFPWTLVGGIDLSEVKGTRLTADDSGGAFAPISKTSSSVDVLPDGTRVVWQHEPIVSNTPMMLRFEVQNRDSSPATDMQPYMGMAAHLEIVRNDLTVFAHIHPSGSAPMAALMLAGDGGSGATMTMADGSSMAMREKIGPELSMPYGFPKPGLYRVFVQFKRAGAVETAVFDVQVEYRSQAS